MIMQPRRVPVDQFSLFSDQEFKICEAAIKGLASTAYLFHSSLNDTLLVEYWKERDQRTLQHESKSPTVTQVGADYTEWYTALQCGGNGWFPGLA